MPRKTAGRHRQQRVVDRASMRPRPDAAENPAEVTAFVEGVKQLQ